MLIGDCASDPPLGATERALATTRADDVVYGLGAAALARGHRAMAVAVADAAARAALRAGDRGDRGRAWRSSTREAAWPAVAAGAKDEVLPASLLVAIADEARAAGARRGDGGDGERGRRGGGAGGDARGRRGDDGGAGGARGRRRSTTIGCRSRAARRRGGW